MQDFKAQIPFNNTDDSKPAHLPVLCHESTVQHNDMKMNLCVACKPKSRGRTLQARSCSHIYGLEQCYAVERGTVARAGLCAVH